MYNFFCSYNRLSTDLSIFRLSLILLCCLLVIDEKNDDFMLPNITTVNSLNLTSFVQKYHKINTIIEPPKENCYV
jgi:hypothetical protein